LIDNVKPTKKITRISFDALDIKSMFGSVVAGVSQINFRAKMHANDVFSFFKIFFNISTSK
jgi:hypothetical protein